MTTKKYKKLLMSCGIERNLAEEMRTRQARIRRFNTLMVCLMSSSARLPAILAKASGDDQLRRDCQSNINKLTQKYKAVAEAAGLRTQFNKTAVEGFEPVRVEE